MKILKLQRLLIAVVCIAAPVCTWAREPSANLELVKQLNQAFVEVAEKVSPAVVVITVIQKPAAAEEDEDSRFETLPRQFRRYFRRQFEDLPQEKSQGQGSGIIIRPDGFILTNGHVVENAESIQVRLQDGRTFKGKIRGVDPQSDVAVVQIEAKGLPVARLGDSTKTRVGEFAIAIGVPYNLDYSVTYGHVSAKGRSNIIVGEEGAAMDQDFIQTDANINPGNSGGPLINIDGEVIGVNTLIRGLHTGIGFAIPSTLAKEVSDQLISEGKFTRAWLGIGIRAVRDDPDFRELIKGVDNGVLVTMVLSNGPAAKSELKPTDVITAVDGKPVNTPQQLRDEIRGKKIGQPVSLDVFRKGKAAKVKVSPGEWINPTEVYSLAKIRPADATEIAELGLSVKSMTHELASQFGVDVTEGVVVVTVEKDTPAAHKGIKPGDIITAVDQKQVATPKQFREALKKTDLKKGILLNLISGNTARFEILKEPSE